MKSFVIALGMGVLSAGAAQAQTQLAAADEAVPTNTTVDRVVVFGRAEQHIGVAMQATEGAVAGADLTDRPILRTGELLEAVPGMIVTQHSGSGKANQYFLRGFNLDHGTDFGMTLDGVPMNFRTHGHGQGYLDINGLIPELIQRIDYRKGPYRADVGDFNLVGGAQITTRDMIERPYALAEVGAYDWKRLVVAGSTQIGGGDLLLAAQGKTYDGPWQLPEDNKALALFGKYTHETPLGALRLSLSTYEATWNPTEQIPDRAIGALVPDAYGAIDPYLHGRTRREILTASLDGDAWRGTLYAQHYDWRMLSNFTFYLDDPIHGDELEQAEQLWTYGGRLERDLQLAPTLTAKVGGEFRYDDIDSVGLYHTEQGRRIGATSLFGVKEASAALYTELTWKPTDRLSLFGGLRGDTYHFNVRPLSPESWSGDFTPWGGKQSDEVLLPKFGASYRLADGLAVYANWGQGFHSNDARGVTSPDNPAPALVKGVGREVGVRLERFGVVATATYWSMDSDGELIYVGDAGSVEPSNPSERHGIELTAFWRPLPGLAIDGVWTQSHARFKDSPGAEFIPGALKSSGELGATYVRPKWNVGARLRYMGVHPLTEDNAHVSKPTTILNLRAAWTPSRYELSLELLNALDSHAKDIEYWYESYLPAIDADGPVEGEHSRAVEPRMLRAALKVSF